MDVGSVESFPAAKTSVVDDVYFGVTKHAVYATPITMNINTINIICTFLCQNKEIIWLKSSSSIYTPFSFFVFSFELILSKILYNKITNSFNSFSTYFAIFLLPLPQSIENNNPNTVPLAVEVYKTL